MFRFILPSAAFLLTLASATPSNGAKQTLNKRANGVTWNVWDAAWQTYDYVVVGGGLTGITVAARLAENPSTSILVIEAGGDNRWDSRVYDIYNYGQAFNSELDWQFSADQGRNIVAYVSLSRMMLEYLPDTFVVGKPLEVALPSMEVTGRGLPLPNTMRGDRSFSPVRPISTGHGAACLST
jgi:hypothetical protein